MSTNQFFSLDLTPPLRPDMLEQVFGLYRLSRMLFVVSYLDIAGHLANAPLDANALARVTNTNQAALANVMDVMVGWGVFARNEKFEYALTPFSERLVKGSSNAANVPFLLGWAGLPATYEAFGDLLYTVRTGQSAFRARYGMGFHDYLTQHPEDGRLYDEANAATHDGFAACANAVDLGETKLLVDVGGGQGDFALEFLSRYPQLRAVSFDLPEVIANAQVQHHPAHERLELVGGDAFVQIPAGGDVYCTSTVLRCFDDEKCLRLLKNIRAAMPAHAKLIAFEMLLPETRDHLMLNTANLVARVVYGGRDRTEREYAELCAQAGLRHTQTIPTNGLISAFIAVPA